MADNTEVRHVVSASREIAAPAEHVFELIADPSQQPRWDGNENLAEAPAGQRVHGVGDVFTMTISKGSVRENHVVEFEEGRLIAWLPSEPGQQPPGHLWRWELESVDEAHTQVTHTYDWSRLTDEKRLPRPARPLLRNFRLPSSGSLSSPSADLPFSPPEDARVRQRPHRTHHWVWAARSNPSRSGPAVIGHRSHLG